MKELYIIAGCNGAGKTTASMTILPEVLKCREFVNADEIAKGISPFKPEEVAIEAGRIMLQRIDYLLRSGISFAIETTRATKSYRNLILRAQDNGYTVILLFFWLPSPEMAEERVAARVAAGGHNIPNDVIYRRYWSGLYNLFNVFVPIVDFWALYENGGAMNPIIVNNRIIDNEKFNKIKESCRTRKE